MIDQINKKQVKFPNLPTIDDLLKKGFTITFEAKEPYDLDDPEDQKWYCDRFLGDSNAPWKPGTIQGIGRGSTQEIAYENAVVNLQKVVSYTTK